MHSHKHTWPPLLSVSLARMVHFFKIKEEPTMTHHYHQKSIVYLRVYSWFCIFYGFKQMYNNICPSLLLSLLLSEWLYILPDSYVEILTFKGDAFSRRGLWQVTKVEPSWIVHCCCSVVSDPLWPPGLQYARLPCPSSPRIYSNSCSSSQ